MNIFSFFSLLGGLAFFLFGMNIMGTSLEKLSGGKLEKVLEKLTSSPIKGVFLGLAVTAVIQSSSATTVMVVGFVNSGIMKLSQAAGVIMGANIGTTVTAWILSLTGLQGDGLLINLLKPTNFSPVIALAGIVLYMFCKSEKKKEVGTICLGFALLMFGMDTMSTSVQPLADDPTFTSVLTMFSNPVFGVLAGALLTAVIQSSSASVGILQALSSTGVITFGAAIPIIMGQNIGTCATALISSVGTNKNAKRAAFIHLYFNIIGTTIFLLVFYIFNAIFKFSFIDGPVNELNIAVVHTVFNVLATAVLLPFNKQLEKLATLTVKDGENADNGFRLLDERFLATPSYAVEQCAEVSAKMSVNVEKSIVDAINMIGAYSDKTAAEITESESLADAYEDRIGTYLVKLAGHDVSASDSSRISGLLHTIGDLERISDHSVNIMESSRELKEKELEFPEEAVSDIKVISEAVKEIVSLSFEAFRSGSAEGALRVEPLEEVIDELRSEIKTRQIDRLRDGFSTMEMGFIFTDLLTDLERVADHCSNIAITLIQSRDNVFDVHSYIDHVHEQDEEFGGKYKDYKKKYALVP